MTNVLTWNVGGRTSGGVNVREAVENVIIDEAVDVACLQEFGSAPKDSESVQTFAGGQIELYAYGSDHMLDGYYFLHYQWDERVNKVNPAILWNGTLTDDPEGAVAFPDPDDEWWRNAIGFGLPDAGDPAFFTVHAISGRQQAPDARYLLEQVDDLVDDPWVVAGDYNTQPDDLRRRLRHHGHGWGVRPPDGATRGSGRVIDYLVHTGADEQPGSVRPMPTVRGHPVSDHYPVLFEGV